MSQSSMINKGTVLSCHYHLSSQSVKLIALASPDPLVLLVPTHNIYQGMEEAIEWYIESICGNNK